MKFDHIIGNPPHQDDTGDSDNKTFMPPVYHKFLEAAYEMSDKVMMIHPARFLFNAGQTPKSWNETMLADPHLKVERYEPDSSKVFPNTEIKGGVAITYHDVSKDYGAVGIFTTHEELNAIKSRVVQDGMPNIADIVFTQCRFNLNALYADHPELKAVIGSEGKDKRFRNNIFDKVPLFAEDKSAADDIQVLGVVRNKRVWRYIPRKYVSFDHENLQKWKVLVPRVNGNGGLGDVLSSPIVAAPMVAYTQTFIGIGAFESEYDAQSLLKYIKTKFARTMLSLLKITQDNEREVWRCVPLQDFTPASDIDWSLSVPDVDRQLYTKYGLSEAEIAFIESHVREMT